MLALICLSFVAGALGAPSSCPQGCDANYAPVCGSNGRTYSALGAPTSCPQGCGAVYSPVCGSNGRTYSNACALDIASCQSQLQQRDPIHQVHSGSCSSGNILGGILGGSTACDQICDEVRSPVCASDGVVYENRCKFTVAQCEAAKNGTRLSIVSYTSVCHTPIQPNCEKYSVNTSDLAIEGQVGGGVKIVCPHSGHEVCSTHGTYKSECQLCQTIDTLLTTFGHFAGFSIPDYKILYHGPCLGPSSNYPGGPYPGGIPIDFGGVNPV